MILEKRYPFGGKETRHWGGKIVVDEKTGIACYRLGFVPRENIQQGEPVLIPLREIRTFCEDLGVDINNGEEKEPFKIKIAKKFLGKDINRIVVERE